MYTNFRFVSKCVSICVPSLEKRKNGRRGPACGDPKASVNDPNIRQSIRKRSGKWKYANTKKPGQKTWTKKRKKNYGKTEKRKKIIFFRFSFFLFFFQTNFKSGWVFSHVPCSIVSAVFRVFIRGFGSSTGVGLVAAPPDRAMPTRPTLAGPCQPPQHASRADPCARVFENRRR